VKESFVTVAKVGDLAENSLLAVIEVFLPG